MALSLICPMISRALDEERALEAAEVDVRDALEAFRLAFNNMLGDWRSDPAVTVETTRSARVWDSRANTSMSSRVIPHFSAIISAPRNCDTSVSP